MRGPTLCCFHTKRSKYFHYALPFPLTTTSVSSHIPVGGKTCRAVKTCRAGKTAQTSKNIIFLFQFKFDFHQIPIMSTTTPNILTIDSALPAQCPVSHGMKPKSFTPYIKSWIGLAVIIGVLAKAKAATDFMVTERTIERYMSALKNRKPPKTEGRPAKLSKDQMKELHEAVRADFYQMTVYQLKRKIFTMITGDPDLSDEDGKKVLSEKTFRRILTSIKVRIKSAEVTTEARAAAVSDKRHALTFAVLLNIFTALACPSLVINMDSTQFKVGDTTEGKVDVVFPVECKDDPRARPQDIDKGGMSFFIKYFLIIAADGAKAPPVYLIADSNMKKDECDWRECASLSNSCTDRCHIVFCKSRVPGLKFYELLHHKILMPFFHKQRATATEDNPESKRQPLFFTLDGEKCQLGIYEDARILSELAAANIVVAKPPASTTAITQPCDNSSCFKGPKTRLKNIHDRDLKKDDLQTKILMRRLKGLFDDHLAYMTKSSRTASLVEADDEDEEEESEERALEKLREALAAQEDCGTEPEVDKANGKKRMSARHITSAKNGLLRIQRALDECIKAGQIVNAFTNCGMEEDFDPNYVFDKLFVKARITNEDKNLYCKHLKGLKSEMLQYGEIRDSYMDQIGFAMNTTNKDGLKLYRRRSCILNNLALVAREAADKEERDRKKAEAEEKKEANKKRTASGNEPQPPKKRTRKAATPKEMTNPPFEMTIHDSLKIPAKKIPAIVPPVKA